MACSCNKGAKRTHSPMRSQNGALTALQTPNQIRQQALQNAQVNTSGMDAQRLAAEQIRRDTIRRALGKG